MKYWAYPLLLIMFFIGFIVGSWDLLSTKIFYMDTNSRYLSISNPWSFFLDKEGWIKKKIETKNFVVIKMEDYFEISEGIVKLRNANDANYNIAKEWWENYHFLDEAISRIKKGEQFKFPITINSTKKECVVLIRRIK